MKWITRFSLLCFLLSTLSACQPRATVLPVTTLPAVVRATQTLGSTVTETFIEQATETPSFTPGIKTVETPTRATATMFDTVAVTSTTAPVDVVPSMQPDDWQKLPVIPVVAASIQSIYQHGIESGNNPHAFSKIGDCGSTPAWFLGDFDRGPRYYNLGSYQSLQAVIQEYPGSFSRTSLAARSGFNASSVFAAIWSDPKLCAPGETPLACEYRVHRPVIALITLGTNDIWHKDTFETQMRKIIEVSIQAGVIPVLATKADNAEGDGSINATISRLAYEYGVPLWNYWAAVQSLPDHGLQADQAHLTWGPNRFDIPENLQRAWPIRNLTALQVLEAVMQALK